MFTIHCEDKRKHIFTNFKSYQWLIGCNFWLKDGWTDKAFRFMVGQGHCPMISKYGPSLSKAVGPVDPSFLVVEKSHFNKKIFI